MLDLIMWLGGARRRVLLDHRAVQAAIDLPTTDVQSTELQEDLERAGEQRVCCLWLHGEPQHRYVFHDATQVARAVNQVRCLEHSLNTGFDPVRVDDMETE